MMDIRAETIRRLHAGEAYWAIGQAVGRSEGWVHTVAKANGIRRGQAGANRSRDGAGPKAAVESARAAIAELALSPDDAKTVWAGLSEAERRFLLGIVGAALGL